MKKRYAWILAACSLVALIVAVWQLQAKLPASATPPAPRRPQILVDAGHGGEDGGTMAQNGTLEKDINLKIALPLGDILRLCGYTVTFTRTADTAIYDPTATTLREKKRSDMKNRLALYNQADGVVSIHENHFSGTQYFGTQVFYSPNAAGSAPLAAAIRESVLTLLQPDNKRTLKKGDDSIYLLYKTTVPTALVECGFLSNETERKQLETTTYQQQMALAIAVGVMKGGV